MANSLRVSTYVLAGILAGLGVGAAAQGIGDVGMPTLQFPSDGAFQTEDTPKCGLFGCREQATVTRDAVVLTSDVDQAPEQ